MTQVKPTVVLTRVWYIFIDVVEFTGKHRSMDDMVAIITALNAMVKKLLQKHCIKSRQLITLATGDGMCLGLLSSTAYKQIELAFDLRAEVEEWNKQQGMSKLQFKLRTALNIYDDYKIYDINGKKNLIGHGINTAARILGLCKPGEVVVSQHMYSSLEKDGKYMGAFSPEGKNELKGEVYHYRRIELAVEDRSWLIADAKERRDDGSNEKQLGATKDDSEVISEQNTAPKPAIGENDDKPIFPDSRAQWVRQEDGVYMNASGEHRITIHPTVFFSDRMAGSFPGLDGYVVFDTPDQAAYRLGLFLKRPTHFELATVHGSMVDPIWWCRGQSAMHIEHFEELDANGIVLVNDLELKLSRIAAFNSSAYYQAFIYVEAAGMAPSGAYSIDEAYIEEMKARNGYAFEEYGLYKGEPIELRYHDDGHMEKDGKVIRVEGSIRRRRFLSPYNFVIIPKTSPLNELDREDDLRLLLDRILQGQSTIEDLVAYVRPLHKSNRDS